MQPVSDDINVVVKCQRSFKSLFLHTNSVLPFPLISDNPLIFIAQSLNTFKYQTSTVCQRSVMRLLMIYEPDTSMGGKLKVKKLN